MSLVAELIPNIIGFHVNDGARCSDFVDGNLTINSNDVNWLGYGMYFWDNKSNADYWVREKIRKNIDPSVEEIWIVKANIIIHKMLDLTDHEILVELDKVWKDYCRLKGCKEDVPLGQKIDMLFDFFDMFRESYYVIRVAALYAKLDRYNFFYNVFNKFVKGNIKNIYCVRNDTMIVNRSKLGVIVI